MRVLHVLTTLTFIAACHAQEYQYLFSILAGSPNGAGGADGQGAKAHFEYPAAIAIDSLGFLYVADLGTDCIRKVTQDGTVTTFAGGTYNTGYSEGVGTKSQFNFPSGIAVSPQGTVYVADTQNHVIRTINSAGQTSLLAGTPGHPGKKDGLGADALFFSPEALAISVHGILYVADTGNSVIRAINPSGSVATLNTGTIALLHPQGIVTDSNEDLWIANTGRQDILQYIRGQSNPYQFIGGIDGIAGGQDGLSSTFNQPSGLARNPSGVLYIADYRNSAIRKLTSSGASTVAGVAGSIGYQDGGGNVARFYGPTSLVFDPAGNAYVTDNGNHCVRKITPDGTVSTLAGSPSDVIAADGPGNSSRFELPIGITTDPLGNIYVTESTRHSIRKVSPDGSTYLFAGIPHVAGSADGQRLGAKFNSPVGLLFDKSSGSLFVAETTNACIRRITMDGQVSVFAGVPSQPGIADGPPGVAQFKFPAYLAMNSSGTLYVSEPSNSTIRQVLPNGLVSTLAGTAGQSGYLDGKGSAAQFAHPVGLAVDSHGNIFVADSGTNQVIRKITPDGTVTTWAGLAGHRGWVDGSGPAVRFSILENLTIDSQDSLYATDSGSSTIRRIDSNGNVTTVQSWPLEFGRPGDITFATDGSLLVVEPPNGRIVKGQRVPRLSIDYKTKNPALELIGIAGHTYQIQSASELTKGGDWKPMTTVALTNQSATATDPSGAAPRSYYRALLVN